MTRKNTANEILDVTQMCYNGSHLKGVSLRGSNARDVSNHTNLKGDAMNDYTTLDDLDSLPEYHCKDCGKFKPMSEFPKRLSGLPMSICKECRSLQNSQNASLRKVRRKFRLAANSRSLHIVGTIYLIQAVGTSLVKIGFTKGDIDRRLRQLQGGSPLPLVAVASFRGAMSEERGLHRRFADFNVHDEWFQMTGDLLDYVNELGGKVTHEK